MTVETKIGENGKYKKDKWVEWRIGGKMEPKKLEHEKDTSKEWSVKSSMICILLLYVLFLSYIAKESKVSTKGRKNTQVQSQAFPIFHSKLGLHLTLIYLFLVSSKIV